MGSRQTSKVVSIIFNIDSGGRGDLKEARVILTNIFGEDCLGGFSVFNLTSTLCLSSEIRHLCVTSQGNVFTREGDKILSRN